VNGLIQYTQHLLKIPGDPSYLDLEHEKIILETPDQNPPIILYYLPIKLSQETIEAIENSETHEWFPIITKNNKTIHWLGITDQQEVEKDITIKFTEDNYNIQKIVQQLRTRNQSQPTAQATTSAPEEQQPTERNEEQQETRDENNNGGSAGGSHQPSTSTPYIAVARTTQYTNQTQSNNFGFNKPSREAHIIHPTTRRRPTPYSANPHDNYRYKITIDRNILHTKPNIGAIWNRTTDASWNIRTNIYIRRLVNVQHEYYTICETTTGKGIDIQSGETTLHFTRIHPISTKYRYIGKIFYNLQDHEWLQLTTGTNNICLLLPLIHEPYHSKLRTTLFGNNTY
jgi:hypothetical protein